MYYKVEGIPCKCSEPPLISIQAYGTERNEGNQNELVGCPNGKCGCGIIKMSFVCKKLLESRETPFQFVPISVKRPLKNQMDNNSFPFQDHFCLKMGNY
jgi:hypothetical protein